MTTETVKAASATLTTDAYPHANNLVYTAPGSTATTLKFNLSNTDGTTGAVADVVVDVGGAGTTFRYVMPKYLTIPAQGGYTDTLTLNAGDKLRSRKNTSVGVDIYVSLLETA